MRSLLYVAVAGALALPLSAGAGVVGTISTVIDPLSTSVNYSGPTDARYVGFKVIVENVGGSVANKVLYTSNASVANSNEPVSFHGVEGATCDGSGTSVVCDFGQMRPGDRNEFVVVFTAPVKNASAPATNAVTYSALTYFSEGTGGPKSKPSNSTSGDTQVVTLEVATGASAASVVPGGTSGFSLYTAPNDVFSTRVTLPAQAKAVAASIKEGALSETQDCNNFSTCYQSTVTIPGAFSPYLTIVLHQDAATIKTGTDIGSVQIFYDYVDAYGQPASHPVSACADATTPRTDGLPCVASAIHYKNNSVPGYTRDLNDDFVWTLINTVNGSYRVF